MDAYRTHRDDGNNPAVIGLDGGVHIDALADEPAIGFHHKVQFRDEGGILPQAMQDIVLQAAGPIDVPECLTDEVFHLVIFSLPLVADDISIVHCLGCLYVRFL